MSKIKRKATVSDARLYSICIEVLVLMVRDEDEFIERGVSVADRTAFEAKMNEFIEFPSDDDFLGQTMVLNKEKMDMRMNLSEKLRDLTGYFEQAFGKKSPEYNTLRIRNYPHKSYAKFISICLNVAEKCEDKFLELSAIGLTQPMIDDFKSEIDLLEEKMLEVNKKEELRQAKANQRAQLANELFEKATFFCTVGKLIWRNSNASRYNNYLITRMMKKNKRSKEKGEEEEGSVSDDE